MGGTIERPSHIIIQTQIIKSGIKKGFGIDLFILENIKLSNNEYELWIKYLVFTNAAILAALVGIWRVASVTPDTILMTTQLRLWAMDGMYYQM